MNSIAPPPMVTHGRKDKAILKAPTLSMLTAPVASIETRHIALLAAPGCNGASVSTVKSMLERAGAVVDVVSVALGTIPSADHEDPFAVRSFLSTASVLYDAVVIADGEVSAKSLSTDANAIRFVSEAHRHFKAIAAVGAGRLLLMAAHISFDHGVAGVVADGSATDVGKAFIVDIKAGRHWSRNKLQVL